jgi:hypothetical protein
LAGLWSSGFYGQAYNGSASLLIFLNFMDIVSISWLIQNFFDNFSPAGWNLYIIENGSANCGLPEILCTMVQPPDWGLHEIY